jgi:hypothetical protein
VGPRVVLGVVVVVVPIEIFCHYISMVTYDYNEKPRSLTVASGRDYTLSDVTLLFERRLESLGVIYFTKPELTGDLYVV